MAALCEELTLCVAQGGVAGGVQGLESAGGGDRVLLTEAGKTVTLHKVSDQRPLGSWAVKQGQKVTCPAVYNHGTGECVMVIDKKVLRLWKEEEVSLEKVFKTTLSAEVHRIHSLPDTEPLVLFSGGAVRFLDALLADPRQEVENVLSDKETIQWSQMFVVDGQPVLMYITKKDPDMYVNIWKPSLTAPLRYKLQPFHEESRILNFTTRLKKNVLCLLILYTTGDVCQSLVPLLQSTEGDEPVLSVSTILHLPEPIDSGALVFLDDSHLATLTPSTEKQKDLLCIWNISFQTMQESKMFSYKTVHQLWNYDRTLYIPCKHSLQVLRYICEPSSLASVMGKASNTQTSVLETVPIVSWESFAGNTNSKAKKKPSQASSSQERCLLMGPLSDLLNSPESLQGSLAMKKVSGLVRKVISSQSPPDLQISARDMVKGLINRSRSDSNFYPQTSLIDLVETRTLSYSLCSDLIAIGLERSDVRLLQLCLCRFVDVPESVICSCLKTFLSVGDDVLKDAVLDTTSVEHFISVNETSDEADNSEQSLRCATQNGFTRKGEAEVSVGFQMLDILKPMLKSEPCPVSRKRAALLNTILSIAYSESYLLPHLKDLTSDQVVLFLSYLQFLYTICSEQLTLTLPDQEELSITQVIDWINLLLDANFTVLVKLPTAKPLLRNLQKSVHQQMKLYSELNKIEGSLSELRRLQEPRDGHGRYSIEVLELY